MTSNSNSDDLRRRWPDRFGVGGLKRRFSRLAMRSVESFSTPRFRPHVLTSELGISPSTLANWLTGEALKLDANRNRKGKGEHRLFSARDVVLLSAAAHVAALGGPFAVTKTVAEVVVAEIISSIDGGPELRIPPLELLVFRGQKTWWVVHRFRADGSEGIQFPSRKIVGKVFASDEWKDITIDDDVPDTPPVHIVFDVATFSRDVLGALNIMVMSETSNDFRRAAES
jgi:hypothetical protein